jgi:hypothetical protein
MPTGGADGASTLKKRVRRRYSPFSTYTYFPFIRFLFFFRRYKNICSLLRGGLRNRTQHLTHTCTQPTAQNPLKYSDRI